MRTLLPAAFVLVLFSACTGSRHVQASNTSAPSSGHTRKTEVAYLDHNTYKLTGMSEDTTYGYHSSNPVKVGGAADRSGPLNERRFLNGLAGPNGEAVQYHRTGSCCAFRTPNGFNHTGLLDRYKVYWEGCTDTTILYINMYDKGDLKVPAGFKARS